MAIESGVSSRSHNCLKDGQAVDLDGQKRKRCGRKGE